MDGHALLYRAFHAIPGLATKAGLPTNAVFGFIRMLRQLEADWRPSHVAVVFDAGLPAHRVSLLDTYKANRPPMPEALRLQVPLVLEYVERAGLATRRLVGQEADDVLASFASQLAGQCAVIRVASGDKDLMQIVTDRVRMVSVSGPSAEVGPAEVSAKTGVAPRQIVEWLALVGDSADNIPGVPGIGPKTSANLLATYGSLEALWPRLDELGNARLRAILAAHRGLIERNVALMVLGRNLACGAQLEELVRGPERVADLLPFFERLEFGRLAAEMRQADLFRA